MYSTKSLEIFRAPSSENDPVSFRKSAEASPDEFGRKFLKIFENFQKTSPRSFQENVAEKQRMTPPKS